jgi:tetratricopeptide (TPR) repeat protein
MTNPPEADAAYSEQVDSYLALAAQSLEGAFGPERAMWMDRLEQEHARGALQRVFGWLIEQGDAERGLRLAYLLQELWFEDHHTGEARALLATMLALPAAAARTSDRARYLDLAGALALNMEDFVAARTLKQEAVAICRELDDRAGLGSALVHLGHVELYAGDLPAARELYREARQIFVDLGDPAWIAHATGHLGRVALESGDYGPADKLVREAVRRYRDLGLEWETAATIGNAAGVAAGLGQPERALRLAGASAAHRERIGVSLPPMFRVRFEQIIAPARHALTEPEQTRLWAEGQAMTLEQATEYALDSIPGTRPPT